MAVIGGTDGQDVLQGTEESDIIQAGGGRDELRGRGGNDALYGGDRYDVLIGDAGADWLDGGVGFDLAAYWYDPAAISVDLASGHVVDGWGTVDRLVAVDAVFGSNFDDTFSGSEAGDVMVGLYGGDVMRGLGGADLLEGGEGDDSVDGGGGHDAFIVSLGKRAGQVAAGADGTMTLTSALGTDRMADVEEIRFLDGRMVYSADDPALQVTRLYEAALDRAPEQAGLEAWIGAIGAGAPLSALAGAFLGSAEFTARFGNLPDNGAFLDRMYMNVLGREADAAGKSNWLDAMKNGMGRADVLVGFSESAENRGNTAAAAAGGVWDADEAMAVLARLYHSALDRRPDAVGFEHWKDVIEDREQGWTMRDVAGAFLASPEFQSTYGALSNREYAATLYRNALGREPDQGGLDQWTAALDAGRARVDVLFDFSESAEHVNLTAAVVVGAGPGDLGVVFA